MSQSGHVEPDRESLPAISAAIWSLSYGGQGSCASSAAQSGSFLSASSSNLVSLGAGGAFESTSAAGVRHVGAAWSVCRGGLTSSAAEAAGARTARAMREALSAVLNMIRPGACRCR